MAFAKCRTFTDPRYDLCDIVTQHLTDGLGRLKNFHESSFSKNGRSHSFPCGPVELP